MADGQVNTLAALARQVDYPSTPDISAAVMERVSARPRSMPIGLRWGIALAALLVMLMAVPAVRGRVFEFIRIGAIEVAVEPTTETPPAVSDGQEAIGPVTATPRVQTVDEAALPASAEPRRLPYLAGETTLDEAEEEAGVEILLPAYPPDLGLPDHVYLQSVGGPVIVLVWLDEAGFVELAMHVLGPGVTGTKGPPVVVEEATVNGNPALWTEGPYSLVYMDKGTYAEFIVEGHVLIWTVGDLTYRLETSASKDYAVQIAESLRARDAGDEPVGGNPADRSWYERLAEQGAAITAIRDSKMEGYFYPTQHALWVETTLGVMEVLFFEDEVDVEISLTQSDNRYLYTFTRTSTDRIRLLDSGRPLYFTVVDDLLMMTSDADLHAVLTTIGQEIKP